MKRVVMPFLGKLNKDGSPLYPDDLAKQPVKLFPVVPFGLAAFNARPYFVDILLDIAVERVDTLSDAEPRRAVGLGLVTAIIYEEVKLSCQKRLLLL